MPPDETLSGGCQCGAVRFRAARIGRSAICHCRMCQKAFGGFFGPLVTVGDLAWTRGEAKFFRSSNLARRGFCSECGTPLCYIQDDAPFEMAIGAFDDPARVAPVVQFNLRHRLALVDALAGLPPQPDHEREAEHNARVVSRQHPDHDTAAWPLAGAGAA